MIFCRQRTTFCGIFLNNFDDYNISLLYFVANQHVYHQMAALHHVKASIYAATNSIQPYKNIAFQTAKPSGFLFRLNFEVVGFFKKKNNNLYLKKEKINTECSLLLCKMIQNVNTKYTASAVTSGQILSTSVTFGSYTDRSSAPDINVQQQMEINTLVQKMD